ncbi:U3 small nucleolar RNA-associated protein 18 homolog [Chrysoperla carnea]|uniref:U3 small nucleolar RNA-associated protein 18 homolog n=1 Tax=Chrysoperla carnea TaxID=189513 RepID=UPI001D0862AC|nr:U3 small nucleolar RNA-associated protein 18 homolog [Chrysoperla carnea]
MGKKRTNSESVEVKESKKFAYEDICAEEERLSKLLFGDVNEVIKTETVVEKPSENVPESTAAWEDEDDASITVQTALQSQKRKLPNGGVNEKQNTYSSLLKHKYKNLVGTPKWAKLDKVVDGDDSDDEILRSCGHIASNSIENTLRKGTLEIKQLTDLNAETYTEGPFIHSLEFHPTSTVGLVAGPSAIFSLFAVDGKRNNKIHSVKLDQFPIKCAKFNGDEIVFGSARHNYMYIYDLEKAQAQRIFLPQDMTNMQRFEMSPCGNYIAVSGRFGELFLLNAKSKEKIGNFKQDSKLRAISFTPDSNHIYAHSETGTVTVWDVKMQRVVNRWYDEGCIQGSSIDVSPCGQYVATGSFEGVVNLYDRSSLDVGNPKPLKAIMNLTTCITGLKFNSTSEILAFSSREKDGDVKLLHVNSKTVFSNFPGLNTKLHKINSIAFSPLSGYFAVGNNKSKVLLYRLKHYASY